MSLAESVREFPDLSHHAFQHPADSKALAVLKKVPLLPQISRKVSEVFSEGFMRMHFVSSAVRVGPNQYPSLYKQYLRMAEVLDVRKLPDLYIKTDDTINAYAMGQENYFIVVNTGIMELLTEDELLAIIGHELGHIKCDHMMYNTMANFLMAFGTGVLDSLFFGLGKMATIGFQLALLEWSRKAEFSCDRAALLVTQDKDSVRNALGKLAGYTNVTPDKLDIEELRKQADEYQEMGAKSMFTKMVQIYLMLGNTHPYPVVRVDEISKWADSDEYARILDGDYVKMSGELVVPEEVVPPLETPTGVLCPKCGAAWSTGTSFCGKCRTNLRGAAIICGACRSPIEPEWVACPACGSLLKDDLATDVSIVDT